jgi:hypothetical protein
MDTINLTEKELIEITGKKRSSSQINILRKLGFEIKVRPDGKPILCREHYLRMMGVVEHNQLEQEPNFDFLDA